MDTSIIDYLTLNFQSNSFILVNLYYYLDMNSLIKLIHTNKNQYKNHKLIYSIILSYIYKRLILFRDAHVKIDKHYGLINKSEYLFIMSNNINYALYDNLYYYIDYHTMYKFIYETCLKNNYLNKKIKPRKKICIHYDS